MSGTSVEVTDDGLQFGNGVSATVTFTATYNASGVSTGVTDSNLVLTEANGVTETFSGAYGGSTGAPYQILFGGFPTDSKGNPGQYGYVYLDYNSETPSSIALTEPNGQYSSVAVQGGSPIALTNGGTATSDTLCFVEGTQVSVPGGVADVRELKMGDLILLADGRSAPIRWIGRTAVVTRSADWMRTAPIRISAGALEDNLPVRDLLVSPCHALLVDGVLIQAGALVNGSTIVRQLSMPATFTYYHIELENHELILAEGVAAETFVDNADRLGFDNWAEHETLFGTGSEITEMSSPRAKSARQVPAATLRRLSDRAAALVPVAA